MIRAGGYDISLQLAPYAIDASLDEQLTASLRRAPSDRLQRMIDRLDNDPAANP